MPKDFLPAKSRLRGRVRASYVEADGGLRPAGDWSPNEILYDWTAIAGNSLLRKGENYAIGGVYFEFENTASPGDAVVAPALDRGPDMGRPYYADLAESANRDYLRVPLFAGALSSTDEDLYPLGNLMTFMARTTGSMGVNGHAYSSAANSKVFGAALVAFVDADDPASDIVFSRFYFPTAKQLAKPANLHVAIDWEIELQ